MLCRGDGWECAGGQPEQGESLLQLVVPCAVGICIAIAIA